MNAISILLRWLLLVIALGPIPAYWSDLRWQYWISTALFMALWSEVGPVSVVVSKMVRLVTRDHAGLAWAIFCAAFLWSFAFGWARETDVSSKLAVTTVLLFVAGFLSVGKKHETDI